MDLIQQQEIAEQQMCCAGVLKPMTIGRYYDDPATEESASEVGAVNAVQPQDRIVLGCFKSDRISHSNTSWASLKEYCAIVIISQPKPSESEANLSECTARLRSTLGEQAIQTTQNALRSIEQTLLSYRIDLARKCGYYSTFSHHKIGTMSSALGEIARVLTEEKIQFQMGVALGHLTTAIISCNNCLWYDMVGPAFDAALTMAHEAPTNCCRVHNTVIDEHPNAFIGASLFREMITEAQESGDYSDPHLTLEFASSDIQVSDEAGPTTPRRMESPAIAI